MRTTAPSAAPAIDRPVGDAPPSTGRRPSARTLLVGLLLTLAVAVAAALLLTMPSIQSATPRELVADSTPTFQVRIANPTSIPAERVELLVDGRRRDARVQVLDDGALVRIHAPRIADGEHDVEVRLRRVGVLRRTLTDTWTLRVDTEAPAARIVEPDPASQPASPFLERGTIAVTKLPLRLVVDAEAGSTITASSTRTGTAEAVEAAPTDDERRALELELPQGLQGVAVVARDEAGNETRVVRRVLVDTSGPQLTLRAPRVVGDARLALPLGARDPHGVTLQVRVNGTVHEDVLVERSTTPPPNATAAAAPRSGTAEPAPGGDPPEADARTAAAPPVAGSWQLQLAAPTYEGRHVVQVVATDTLGNRRTLERTIVVDSGEQLGSVVGLRPGARGADVVELHDALVAAKVVARPALAEDARSRTYGAATRQAIQTFQQRRGMATDGVAGPDTIAALTLKIVIDRGAHTLTLYRIGEAVKTWGVAVGSSEFPTPAGEFEIVNMQKDPTWTPPDSEWAKDAEVTPPGPDNPLGTRWMGIGGAIGIHGTNSPTSIGYSVSHGCIRMTIPDVEVLFEMVSVGTPVTVV